MRSWATRSTNWYGPAQTGLLPNLSPSAWATLGATIMPARSASWASSGANGAERLRRTVDGSMTSTLETGASSPRRLEPGIVLWRSMLYLTAAASIVSPSWNLTPLRSLIVSALPSADHWYPVASCGMMLSLSSMSNSLSHIAENTMRPTKVRASVGSRTSGSSASPMRRVWACATAADIMNSREARRGPKRLVAVRMFFPEWSLWSADPPMACPGDGADRHFGVKG